MPVARDVACARTNGAPRARERQRRKRAARVVDGDERLERCVNVCDTVVTLGNTRTQLQLRRGSDTY
eukprot:6196831-Pleurochrysis_carterae.AAC.2